MGSLTDLIKEKKKSIENKSIESKPLEKPKIQTILPDLSFPESRLELPKTEIDYGIVELMVIYRLLTQRNYPRVKGTTKEKIKAEIHKILS